MSDNRLSGTSQTDFTNNLTDYSVETLDTDSPTGIEINYIPDWTKWHGYYREIPELQAVIDKKALWSVGKGFKADETKKKILDKIKGFGKDTFNSIMYNAVRTYTICGDFFAEIIKDKAGRLINLKPINPGSISIVVDGSGMVIRYEQSTAVPNIKIKFQPDEIFHLAWNRIADEIHGISTIQKCENIILMRNEAMSDLKTVFHRYVKPVQIIPVDEDDETKIAAFKTKYENAYKNTETLIVPKGTVDVEGIKHISIPQFSTLDPLPWIQELQKFFIMSEGVPEIILGYGKDTTEASSKIQYLAFQQMVEHNQLFLEEQIKSQLGIEIEFEFPASLDAALQQDQKKDGTMKGEKKSELKPNAK